MKAPIGARVSIRFHDPEGGFRDLVGYLESENTLRNRHGELIEFDREKIALYKVIEEKINLAGHGAPLSVRIQELENVLTATWPPVKQELFGKWLLRTSGKFTMRANSVLPCGKAPFGEPPEEIDEAIAHVVAHFEKQGLAPTFSIPLPTYQELDSKLFDNGWIEKVRAHVMVGDIAPLAMSKSNFKTTISESFDDAFLALQDDHGVAELMRAYPALYASVFDGEKLIGVGRTSHADGWSALSRVFVDPAYRGQGVGKLIVNALLGASFEAGIKKSVLQVDSKNTVAISLYSSLGFSFHHEYVYRSYQKTLNLISEECC
jgi:ribosomal protein S18 acetylase RimI-like enzyme